MRQIDNMTTSEATDPNHFYDMFCECEECTGPREADQHIEAIEWHEQLENREQESV